MLAGCLQNPPPELLEQECERNTSFALALLAVLPVRSDRLLTSFLDRTVAC
eukprot:COSAG04_NODE_1294_length_7333_cov_3.307575_3_plen_51_part_00